MEYEKLKAAAETITMPEDMKRRIVRDCSREIEKTGKETGMKYKKNTILGRPAAVFAALAICLSLSVTALASSGVMEGFFREITNWQGAIVGMSYEQATDEIRMEAAVNGDVLTVLATFSIPQEIPYSETEKLGIAAYRIVDAKGKVVKEGASEAAEVVNGKAAISIRLGDVPSGSYKLIVTAFVSEKKADQPLNINGRWECDFNR